MFNFGFNFCNFNNPFVSLGIGAGINPCCVFNLAAPSFFMPQYSFMNWGFNNNAFRNNTSIFQQQQINKNNMSYNQNKGEILVQNAIAGTPDTPPENPLCARYVNNAIVRTGIGAFSNANGQDTKFGLRANMNFKEVKVDKEDFATLPAGSTIVYDANDSGIDQNGNPFQIGPHGHVVIAKGDGTGISDRFESSILPSDNAYVFIPI